MKWNDEYWPLLVKLYKKKPEGVKPVYSRPLVELALTLHINPRDLHRQMLSLRNPSSPFVIELMERYSSASKLNKAVKATMQSIGFGTAGEFYEGVEINEEPWENDFRPLKEDASLTPLHLILILNLYFQLTPTTMVRDTEEIQDLARLLKVSVDTVLRVMEIYLFCDPDMPGDDFIFDDLMDPACEIWNRYGSNPEPLAAQAAEMIQYF